MPDSFINTYLTSQCGRIENSFRQTLSMRIEARQNIEMPEACSLAMERHLTSRQLIHHTPRYSILVFLARHLVGICSLTVGTILRTLWAVPCIHKHFMGSLRSLRLWRDTHLPLRCSFREQSQNRNENLTKHIVCLIRREPPNPSQASVSSAVGALKV